MRIEGRRAGGCLLCPTYQIDAEKRERERNGHDEPISSGPLPSKCRPLVVVFLNKMSFGVFYSELMHDGFIGLPCVPP